MKVEINGTVYLLKFKYAKPEMRYGASEVEGRAVETLTDAELRKELVRRTMNYIKPRATTALLCRATSETESEVYAASDRYCHSTDAFSRVEGRNRAFVALIEDLAYEGEFNLEDLKKIYKVFMANCPHSRKTSPSGFSVREELKALWNDYETDFIG